MKYSFGHIITTLVRRPRKGAWIEIGLTAPWGLRESVAPARGRGLKYLAAYHYFEGGQSPPQGGVD